MLEKEALPLLRGIADGTLDPTAGDVRDRCARHAAVLRHALTRGAPDVGDLASGLETALETARERGLLVTVQLVGDPGPAPPRLARAILATVDAVLRALPPQQVTLTVLAVGDEVELYLAFDTPSPGGPDLTHAAQQDDLPAAAHWRASRERGRGRRRLPGNQLAKGRCRLTAVIDVAVVDDHPIILESAASWIMADSGDIRLVATAATVDALLAGPGRHADVVLLDLGLGDGTTVDGNVAAILGAGPAVLVLSASDRPVAVRAAMRAGARGYVLKNEQATQIRSAIREVAAGRDWISARLAYIFATDDTADLPALSQQERRTLELYATGLALKSVARKLAISEDTAKQYLGRVREKYANAGRAAPTKMELYYRAVEDGYLPPPP